MSAITPKKIRFSLVSISATAIDFGVLFLVTSLSGLSLIRANYISAFCGFICSFFANKKFTFKTPRHRVKREVVLYIIITLIGIWIIQPLIIWPVEILLRTAGWHGLIVILTAKVIASLVTFIWNYFGYSRIVFKKPPQALDEPHLHTP